MLDFSRLRLFLVRELIAFFGSSSAVFVPSNAWQKVNYYSYLSITYACQCPPTFAGAVGWGSSDFRFLGAHFVVLSGDGVSAKGYARLRRVDGENEDLSEMITIRYCPRVHSHFPVVFTSESSVGEGTVVNVSVPGCAIQSRKRVQPGSYLEMRVLVPDTSSPLHIGLAKVRWSDGRRFGVEFIRMPGTDQIRLGHLVKTNVNLESPSPSSRWRDAECASGRRPT